MQNMKNMIKIFVAIGCLSLLTACAGLPESVQKEAATDTGLILIHQDKSVCLYARPDFNPLRFGEFALDRVEVETASSLDAEQKADQERLGTDLATQITTLLTTRDSTSLTARNSASSLNMNIRLRDIRPVTPALNMTTLVLVLVPLDTGAIIAETTYRDNAGRIQARRIEQLTGSIFNFKASFSTYGQHKIMLSEWAQHCPMSAACLSTPAVLKN